MEKAFEQASIKLTLRDGLAKGYWTQENLDQPSAGWTECERTWRRHPLNISAKHRAYENLIRDTEDDGDFYSSL